MPVEVTRMIASVGCSIAGSGTVSTRTSWVPCQATAFMPRRLSSQGRGKHLPACSSPRVANARVVRVRAVELGGRLVARRRAGVHVRGAVVGRRGAAVGRRHARGRRVLGPGGAGGGVRPGRGAP